MRKVSVESGVSFDPKVVEVLQRRYVELEAMAQTLEGESAKLSTDVKVERGLEPAAGFENTKRPASSTDKPSEFLSSIAAARQEVQTLFELAQDLGNSLSLNETLSLLAMRLKRMIHYDSLAIYVLRGDKLRAEYVDGENFRLFSSLEIPLGQGLSGWVAENRKPIINGNPSVKAGYLQRRNQVHHHAQRLGGAADRAERDGQRSDALSQRAGRFYPGPLAHLARHRSEAVAVD